MDKDVHFSKQSDGSLRPVDSHSIRFVDSLPIGKHISFTPNADLLAQSDPQRKNAHRWYVIIGDALGMAPVDVKNMCKLMYGVPILRADDSAFRALYDRCFKSILNYEEKLDAMNYLPVTSLMKKKQYSRYMKDVQRAMAEKAIVLD